MDPQTSSRSRGERLFGVRRPLLYLGLSALWLVLIVVRFVDPSRADRSWGSIAISVVLGALALACAAIAIVNIVMQRRGAWNRDDPSPLAQESDPRLRQQR
ncbi:hypothetical protein BH09ACT5_BH09ACT5_19130 [soil metagenome]